MKKNIVFYFVLLTIGFLLGNIFNKRQQDTQGIKNISETMDNKVYIYEKTIENTETLLIDLTGDGEKEELKLISTDYYRTDQDGDSRPIGCAGSICLEPNEYSEGPYKEIYFYNPSIGRVSSGKIYTGGFGSGHIRIINFNGENFIELGGLNLGAHSSETRIIRIVEEKMVPVCRRIPNHRSEHVDNCVFYSDAGGADLSVSDDGKSLYMIESFKTESGYNFINNKEYFSGIVSTYEDGQFVTQE